VYRFIKGDEAATLTDEERKFLLKYISSVIMYIIKRYAGNARCYGNSWFNNRENDDTFLFISIVVQ